MFEDIFKKDLFDFDEDEPDKKVSDTEKDSGVWDTGKKEDVWRAGGAGSSSGGGNAPADPNDVWAVDPTKDPKDPKPSHGPLGKDPNVGKQPETELPDPICEETECGEDEGEPVKGREPDGDGLDEYGDIEEDMDIEEDTCAEDAFGGCDGCADDGDGGDFGDIL